MAELINQRYCISKKVNDKTAMIYVDIDEDDTITIENDHKQRQIAFTRSDKDLVMAMGLAFQEAAELVTSRKVKGA